MNVILKGGHGMNYKEEKKDLFTVEKDYVLAHCVSQDCALGAGIAKEFRKKIPEMPDWLLSQNPKVGQAIPFETRGGRFVLNLFSKEFYWGKPTYQTLTPTLIALRDWMVENDKTKLAIPTIGCGLDRLLWFEVSRILKEVFESTEIEILVCYLKDSDVKTPKKFL